MATVNLFAQTNMSSSNIWYGTVYRNTSSEIILSNGYYGGIYYGSGFRYSGYSVTGGTLTGYDGAINVNIYSLTYDLAITVRGLNLSARTAYNYIQSGNALGLQEWALSGNDVLNGSIYNDTLLSYNGNDTLNGGLGNDTMIGGTGNDTYIVDSISDVVTESLNQGTDVIQSSVTYTASANVENLKLTGSSNIDATGNTLNNTLTGNSGNNTLNGGSGNDTMVGGNGNDTYVVDSTSDKVTEASNAGTDTIQTTLATYSIASLTNIENLSFVGIGNATLTGNALNNTLTGNSGNNTLNGGSGNDTLTGGSGADTFVFNTALNPTTNRDTITDFSHNDDTIQLSKSVMSALGNLGTLSAADFKLSTQTLDISDRIIYNQTSGALFYDADGSGRSAAVQIALLNSLPTGIDHTDFVII